MRQDLPVNMKKVIACYKELGILTSINLTSTKKCMCVYITCVSTSFDIYSYARAHLSLNHELVTKGINML